MKQPEMAWRVLPRRSHYSHRLQRRRNARRVSCMVTLALAAQLVNAANEEISAPEMAEVAPALASGGGGAWLRRYLVLGRAMRCVASAPIIAKLQ